jgi:ApaG protein
VSDKTTDGVRVSVTSEYLPAHSDPARQLWFFAYHVRIQNQGTSAVQLLSRHWVITDAHGHTEHVRGPGVVGDQPLIRPGSEYAYSSGCPLNTSMGSMHGAYQMVDSKGRQFEAEIEPFLLVDPLDLN